MEHTLKDVKDLAIKLIGSDFTIRDRYGRAYTLNAKTLGYTFKFDNAKRRNGQINYKFKTISLSKPKALVNLHQIDGPIQNTILHEIAHAFSYHLYGVHGRGHDAKWRSIAQQIGCSGDRCSSGYEQPESKYTLSCGECGKEYSMHRAPKVERSCGECSPKFDRKYLLTVTQNY